MLPVSIDKTELLILTTRYTSSDLLINLYGMYLHFTGEKKQCDFISIDLKNAPLSKQGSLKNVYRVESPINGKPSWNSKFGDYQIWYDPAYAGVWRIGPFPHSRIAAHPMGSIDDNNTAWHYLDYTSNLYKPSGGDMSLKCMNMIGKSFVISHDEGG